MKKDINDLKALVNDLMSGKISTHPASLDNDKFEVHTSDTLSVVPSYSTYTVPLQASVPVKEEMKNSAEYIEETLSLEEVEKEMIKKALDRHHGKRNKAAADLKISERTLYRKIKEYGLE